MRLTPSVLAFALLTLSLGAQRLAIAINDDDTFAIGSGLGAPTTTVAMKFVASANLQAAAAEIFTGNGGGVNRLTIWSHDTVGDRPLSPLALSASWSIVPAFCWQGVAFATPVSLTQGTTYWLVWDIAPNAQNSISLSGNATNVDVALSSNNGTSWLPSQQWGAKLRIYQSSATGTITAYGTAKPGNYGDPTIGVTGFPTVGNPLDIWLDETAPATLCILLIGLPANNPVPPFGTAWVDPAILVFQSSIYHWMPTWRGTTTYTFRVPDVPAAVGLPLSFQWGIFDGAAAAGLAHTAAVTALLQ